MESIFEQMELLSKQRVFQMYLSKAQVVRSVTNGRVQILSRNQGVIKLFDEFLKNEQK